MGKRNVSRKKVSSRKRHRGNPLWKKTKRRQNIRKNHNHEDFIGDDRATELPENEIQKVYVKEEVMEPATIKIKQEPISDDEPEDKKHLPFIISIKQEQEIKKEDLEISGKQELIDEREVESKNIPCVDDIRQVKRKYKYRRKVTKEIKQCYVKDTNPLHAFPSLSAALLRKNRMKKGLIIPEELSASESELNTADEPMQIDFPIKQEDIQNKIEVKEEIIEVFKEELNIDDIQEQEIKNEVDINDDILPTIEQEPNIDDSEIKPLLLAVTEEEAGTNTDFQSDSTEPATRPASKEKVKKKPTRKPIILKKRKPAKITPCPYHDKFTNKKPRDPLPFSPLTMKQKMKDIMSKKIVEPEVVPIAEPVENPSVNGSDAEISDVASTSKLDLNENTDNKSLVNSVEQKLPEIEKKSVNDRSVVPVRVKKDPRCFYTNNEKVDMMLIFGECKRKSDSAASLYAWRHPKRRRPSHPIFSRLLSALMSKWPEPEEAIDMLLIYGEYRKHAKYAAKMYAQRFPHRKRRTDRHFLELEKKLRINWPKYTKNRERTATNSKKMREVLDALENDPDLSRKRLARQLGISPSSVSRIITSQRKKQE